MSKHAVLTQEEVKKGKINPKLLQIIQTYAEAHQLEKEAIKILDWGSGRGQTVGALREEGYEAYGVEIDPLPYYNGLPYFQSKYEKPEEFLQLIDETCLTSFPDNYFDIIFSEQVLEHVADLEKVSKEMSRITKEGGKHLHRFPAKWHLIEDHLYMPAIHWLPKNLLRFGLIYFCVLIGAEPNWPQLSQSKKREKAKTYYQYSIKKTYYRSITSIKNTFLNNCFNFDYKVNYQRKGKKDIKGYFPKSVEIYLEKQ